MNPTLEFHYVSHTYNSGRVASHALRQVTFSVSPGEMVALMGPSGSGKSTVLRIAGGLETPTKGQVLVEGVALRDQSATELAAVRRRAIGYVFQEYNLVPSLTVVENASLPLELDGVSIRLARVQAMGALADVDMDSMADHFPDDLSSGEQQRTAIARAIVGNRRLILADEPTGALDTLGGEGVMRLLRGLCDRGQSAIIATHDATHASWADRVLFLRDGSLVDQARHAGPEVLLGSGRH